MNKPLKTEKQLTQAEMLEIQRAALVTKNKEAAIQVLLSIRTQLSRNSSFTSSTSRNY